MSTQDKASSPAPPEDPRISVVDVNQIPSDPADREIDVEDTECLPPLNIPTPQCHSNNGGHAKHHAYRSNHDDIEANRNPSVQMQEVIDETTNR